VDAKLTAEKALTFRTQSRSSFFLRSESFWCSCQLRLAGIISFFSSLWICDAGCQETETKQEMAQSSCILVIRSSKMNDGGLVRRTSGRCSCKLRLWQRSWLLWRNKGCHQPIAVCS